MWLFLPGGLLMPAVTPTLAKGGVLADPKFTENGRFGLQVRGRVDSHLTNFIRDYVDPMDFDHSDIEYTPQLDYNVRFYMDQEEFSLAVAKAVTDIDFLKFKPTAEARDSEGKPLYKDGNAYHGVLNSIWGTLTKLGAAGGVWGARSALNPNGYGKASKSGYRSFSDTRSIGSTFRDRDSELVSDDLNMDWYPESEERISDLLSEMSGIPTDQWEDYLPEEDYKLIEPFKRDVQKYEHSISKKTQKLSTRRRAKARNRR